ncbi:MAG: class II histone deacetylase [Candidatus Nanopelagicales bacterium]
MKLKTGYLYHEVFGWHDTGTFVGDMPADPTRGLQPYQNYEHADTKRRIHELIVVSGLIKHLVRIEPRYATEEELRLVHTQRHIDYIKSQSESRLGGDAGDLTTPFGKGAFEIATLGVGGILQMVDAIYQNQIDNGYALVRPPGHHAVADLGMGYCLFANGSIAVKYAQQQYGVKRIAVVDWDVHHGNGTQEIFYEDPSVLTISIHQDRLYPHHSGLRSEQGAGVATGTNLNIPLPAGVGNAGYIHAFERVVVPALRKFKPDLILVASGFDSCVFDPLGRMLLTSTGYAALTRQLMQVAAEFSNNRILMTHEGGYNAVYSPFCGQAVLEQLVGTKLIDDPFLDSVNHYPSQDLTPWQVAEIELAEKLLQDLPTN